MVQDIIMTENGLNGDDSIKRNHKGQHKSREWQ